MRALREVGLGAAVGLGANVLAVVAGYASCGGEPGEVPPFLAWVASLWLVQWVYLVPAGVGMLVARRPWMALGLLLSAVVVGVPSAVGFFVMGASTV